MNFESSKKIAIESLLLARPHLAAKDATPNRTVNLALRLIHEDSRWDNQEPHTLPHGFPNSRALDFSMPLPGHLGALGTFAFVIVDTSSVIMAVLV